MKITEGLIVCIKREWRSKFKGLYKVKSLQDSRIQLSPYDAEADQQYDIAGFCIDLENIRQAMRLEILSNKRVDDLITALGIKKSNDMLQGFETPTVDLVELKKQFDQWHINQEQQKEFCAEGFSTFKNVIER